MGTELDEIREKLATQAKKMQQCNAEMRMHGKCFNSNPASRAQHNIQGAWEAKAEFREKTPRQKKLANDNFIGMHAKPLRRVALLTTG